MLPCHSPFSLAVRCEGPLNNERNFMAGGFKQLPSTWDNRYKHVQNTGICTVSRVFFKVLVMVVCQIDSNSFIFF